MTICVARRLAGVAGVIVAVAWAAGAAAIGTSRQATGVSGLRVTHAARALAPGEVVLLTVSGPVDLADVRATAWGQTLPGFADGRPGTWHVLIGIDVDAAPGRTVVTLDGAAGGRRITGSHTLIVGRKAFGQRTLTVDPKFVTPPADVMPRIEKEQKRLNEILAVASPVRLWKGPFLKPVAGAPALNFGQRSVFNGQPRGTHRGGDFSSPSGAPIHAPGAGRVVLAEDLYYSGQTVLLDHGLGMFSLLAHMSKIGVEAGDAVAGSQQVGLVGATGRVTGPHLHWTLRIGAAAVDPMSLLALTDLPR